MPSRGIGHKFSPAGETRDPASRRRAPAFDSCYIINALERNFTPTPIVPSRGIEPLLRAPQARVLSVERRGVPKINERSEYNF